MLPTREPREVWMLRGPIASCVPIWNTDSVDADAIMIHGFIDQAGRFETLKMIVPPALSTGAIRARGVSQEWQFRPAMQGGQSTRPGRGAHHHTRASRLNRFLN